MSKKILVTGAFGLVGSNICKILERDYPELKIIKEKSSQPKITFGETFELEVNGIYDYIIDAAGYGQPQMFSKDKIETLKINTKDIFNLMDFLRHDGKFLYISSSEIYSGAPAPHKETSIGTTTPQHPRACYIEGKRCGEAICMAYKEGGRDVKIARLALAYGPGTKKGDTRVLNQFIEQALTTGDIKMKDAGEAKRTYIYVEDAAKLMLDILFKGKDTVYNVGGTQTITIKKLAEEIAFCTGSSITPGGKGLEGAPDEVKLDMTKTLTEFPMELTPLNRGIMKTINYQKELYGNAN